MACRINPRLPEPASPPPPPSTCARFDYVRYLREIKSEIECGRAATEIQARIEAVFTAVQEKIAEYCAETNPRRKARLGLELSLADTYLDLIEFDRANRRIGNAYSRLASHLAGLISSTLPTAKK